MKKNFLLITGGTGGHVIPAKNFANYLSNKNIKAEFERLNKIRQKNYSKAKFTIDVSKKNKYQIIKEITEALKI